MFDIVFRGGKVVTAEGVFEADVAVTGENIACIGNTTSYNNFLRIQKIYNTCKPHSDIFTHNSKNLSCNGITFFCRNRNYIRSYIRISQFSVFCGLSASYIFFRHCYNTRT